MKNKGFSIGIVFLVLLVCTTCTKDEVLLTPEGEPSALKGALVENVVITLEPSTDGDDTDDIRDALNNAPPGAIVYLTAGVFHISEPILVENFKGALMGAGKEDTEIFTADLGESMFCFQSLFGAYSISISNLSLRYTHLSAPEPTVLRFYEGVLQSNIYIQNVDFIGAANQCTDDGTSVICVLIDPKYSPNIQLETVIEGCTFNQVGEAIKIFRDFESSFLIQENQFINCVNGIVQFSSNASVFNISKNIFEFKKPKCYWPTAGVFLFGGRDAGISRFLIHQNDFVIEFGAGIGLLDNEFIFTATKSMNVEIKSNHFLLMDKGWDGISNFCSIDALISNNKFEGFAWSAIWAGTTWYGGGFRVENMVVLGDNINNLIATEIETYNAGIPIQLWEQSENCTIIGNAKDNVLDLGTNNILTGVNNISNPPGPSVSVAMSNRIQKILAQYNIDL
jgi:hypothetical protein